MLNFSLDPPGFEVNKLRIAGELPIVKTMPFYCSQMGRMRQGEKHFTERDNAGDICQIMFTKKGCGTIIHLGKEIQLEEGQFCILNFSEYQHYKTNGTLWDYVHVFVKGFGIHEYFNNLYENGFSAITPNNRQKTENQLDEITALFDVNTIQSAIQVSVLAYSLLLNLLFDHTYGKSENDFSLQMFKIDSLIMQNLNRKISVAELSKLSFSSVRNFSRKFLSYTGFSPNEYIINLKNREAKKMLSSSYYSIEEIANYLGYSSSSFIKQFKKRFGLSPNQYRKAFRT